MDTLPQKKEIEVRMTRHITVDFTENETAQLGQVIDVAIKTGGIQVAMVAMPLFDKLREATKSAVLVPADGGKIISSR